MTEERKSEIWSLLITLLITVGTVAFLLLHQLTFEYPPKGMEHLLEQQNEDSIYMEAAGEEYVKLGDIPEPTDQAEQQQASDEQTDVATDETSDLDDAGPVSPTPPRTVTSTQNSPMKVKERTDQEKPGARKPNNNQQARKPAASRQAEQRPSVAQNRMRGSFANRGGQNGTSGSPNGNASSGQLSGHASLGGGLGGYTVAYWGRPRSYYEGSVVVQVHVNTRGKVTSARVVGGSGEAYAHAEVQRSCVQESLKSAFSVPKNRTTEGIGTITWRFK